MGKAVIEIHSGLPWPEGYEDLMPLIKEQWGIEEIYLSRKLAGGMTGAMVFAADITGREHRGQAVLKLDRARDSEHQEQSEAERHERAFASAPDYAAKHLPKLLHTLHHGDRLAILSTIAGRGLEYSITWHEVDWQIGLSSIRQVAKGLLEDWNSDYSLAKGLFMPGDLLAVWLRYRLDPQRSRLHGFLLETCNLAPDEPSFVFEGQWYPNPLVFATKQDLPESLRLRAVKGRHHGDLHEKNLLVGSTKVAEGHYYLIDLAYYREDQFLFFDHAYFEINYMLLWRADATSRRWHALLSNLSHARKKHDHRGLYGDDLGTMQLVKTLREEVWAWIDRHESNRLSYMEAQYLLARVAAGLNFANKRLADEVRRKAFLYAAQSLKDLLQLKNVDWPKHGPLFELGVDKEDQAGQQSTVAASTDLLESEPAEPQHPPLTDKPGIAVLAFKNLSGDPDQEYFADGITEEIITDLSHVDWLTVIARSSSFIYKNQAVDVKEVGKQLGVHYVVQGSIRKSEQRLRISVQLTDALTGQNAWAQRYDRDVADIFDLQEEIASTIVKNIDWEIRAVERKRASRKRTNLSALDKFWQGVWHSYKFTNEDTETAKRLLYKAIDLSPEFASSYAVLAILDTRRVIYCETDHPQDDLKQALKRATKAVNLDADNSLAHAALGRVYTLLGQSDRSLSELEAAINLNPSSAIGYDTLAGALMFCGRAEEALSAMEKTLRLNPLGPYGAAESLIFGTCHYFLGNFEKAAASTGKAGQGIVVGPLGQIILAASYAHQGRLDEAQRAAAEVQKIRPDFTLSRFQQCWGGMVPDYLDRLTADLRKAGISD